MSQRQVFERLVMHGLETAARKIDVATEQNILPVDERVRVAHPCKEPGERAHQNRAVERIARRLFEKKGEAIERVIISKGNGAQGTIVQVNGIGVSEQEPVPLRGERPDMTRVRLAFPPGGKFKDGLDPRARPARRPHSCCRSIGRPRR